MGHSNEELADAAIDAAISNTVMQGNLQQNNDVLELSKLLTDASGLDHCFLTTSGAMACENALKIAFQKKFPAHRVLAFDKCFMGRTLALSHITSRPEYREGLPTAIAVDHIPFFDYHNPEKSIISSLEALEYLLSKNRGQYAAMSFELIQGEGGVYPGSRDFFISLMDVLKKNNIAIIIDEVQTFGRTPQLFAYQHFGLEKYVDIVTIGKFSHACATLFTKEYAPRPGLVSQTLLSSTAAIRSAIVIIKTMLNDEYFGDGGKIVEIHNRFTSQLQKLSEKYPLSGPFGCGGMIAFTPFGGERKRVLKLVHTLFEEGVITFIAGREPTRVRLLPPIGSITYEDIDNVIEIIETQIIRYC